MVNMKKKMKNTFLLLSFLMFLMPHAMAENELFDTYPLLLGSEEYSKMYSMAEQEYVDGSLDKSISLLEKIHSSMLYDVNLLNLLAELYIQQKQYKKAIDSYKSLLKLETNSKKYNKEIANVYLLDDDLSNAIKSLEIYLRYNKTDKEALYNLASLYGLNKEYLKAIENFKSLLKLDQENVKAFNGLGLAYSNIGDVDNALVYYRWALALDLNAANYNNVSLCYIKKKQYEDALMNLQYALRLKPDNVEYLYNEALLSVDLGNFEGAKKSIDTILSLDSNNPKALSLLEFLKTKNTENEKQVDDLQENNTYVSLEEFQIHNSNDSIVLDKKEKIDLNSKDSIEKVSSAINTNEKEKIDDVRPQEEAGKPLLEQDASLKKNDIPEKSDLRPSKSTPFELSENQQKIALYKKLVVLKPENIKVRYNLALEYYRNQQYSQAAEQLSDLLTLDKENKHALVLLAASYIQLKKYENAQSIYQKMISNGTVDSEAYRQLGYVYYLLQDYHKAISNYNKALNHDPLDLMARLLLALAYDRIEEKDSQVEQYQEVLKLDPDNITAIKAMGFFYVSNNDLESAEKTFLKLLTLEPDKKINYNYLQTVYLRMDKIDKAIGILTTFIKKFPDDPEGYFYLGNAFARNNQIENAIVNYKKAVALQEQNDQYHYSLGVAYVEKGDKENTEKEILILKELNQSLSDSLRKLLL